MAYWKAGADPEGSPWYAVRQGMIQRAYNGMLEGKGGSRGVTMVFWKAWVDPGGLPRFVNGRGGSREGAGLPWYAERQG